MINGASGSAGMTHGASKKSTSKGKEQGYNDRLDESLGSKDGKESGKSQSYKSRRDESKGVEVATGEKAYSGDKSSSQVGYPDTKNRG
jgi:hypothetical protein|tara:strand:- start:199 stop:462 length:264 start_codon:yes stop_codon:yes gene_type:complete